LDSAPRYMIRDRDRIYGAVVTRRLRAMGIRDKPIAPASPWQNGFSERLIRSIRRECLDHVIVLGEAHLRRILKSSARYYNGVRTHRSLNKDSAGSAIRLHKFARHLGRTSPSLRAGLIFRYTQVDAGAPWIRRAASSHKEYRNRFAIPRGAAVVTSSGHGARRYS
jgi:hypothetical protein